jgi:tRNA A-37 threonylcarbamoyl transferase component Bud32
MGVLAPGATIDGTYQVVRLVGAGGMGEVYEATHSRLSGRYAIKVLTTSLASHPDAVERFRREAEITSALRHPNIVHVMDFNRLPDGSPCLVMEYLEGADLGVRLQQFGCPSVAGVIMVVNQIASALAAAHSRGIVHRDLKPQNVFLVPLAGQAQDVVKVLDFGISKIRAATTELTTETAVLGTPQYMAPEQALGHLDRIDHRTDQFSLAAIAFELLSGAPPFVGETVQAVLYQVVHETPPLTFARAAAPRTQQRIAAVLARALSKNLEDRFPDVLRFAEALTAAHVSPVRPRPARPDWRRARAAIERRVASGSAAVRGWWALAPRSLHARRARWAAVVVAVAALGWLSFAPRARPRPAPPVIVVPPVMAAPARVVVQPLPQPPPATVSVELEGLPEGATIRLDGETSPGPVTLARNGAQHVLHVEAPGFEPYESALIADRDRTIVLALRKSRIHQLLASRDAGAPDLVTRPPSAPAASPRTVVFEAPEELTDPFETEGSAKDRARDPISSRAILSATARARCISCPDPQIPRSYFSEEGPLLVKMCVGPGGAVTYARVVKSGGYPADDVTVARVKDWKFKPLDTDGGPRSFCFLVAFR